MHLFLIKALICGIGIAVISAPIGCFILWRRMAYFGDSLAHAALLGISLGLLLNIHPMIGAFAIAVIFSYILVLLKKYHSSDSILGILAYGCLSLALVVVSLLPNLKIDLSAYLFGEIFITDTQDIILIFSLAAVLYLWLKFRWRAMLSLIINEDLATIDGLPVKHLEKELIFIISLIIAISFKIVGILLITAMLIIPAATSRIYSSTPENMVIITALIGILSVILGLLCSLKFDTPGGASIVTTSLIFFILGNIYKRYK